LSAGNLSNPSVNTEPILPAQVGSAETQSAAPKPLLGVLPKWQMFFSRLSSDQTASKVLDYLQHKTKTKNITMEKLNFTHAGDTSPFKITVPKELFSTTCSADFWPARIVVKEFETKNWNSSKRKRPEETRLLSSVALSSFTVAQFSKH